METPLRISDIVSNPSCPFVRASLSGMLVSASRSGTELKHEAVPRQRHIGTSLQGVARRSILQNFTRWLYQLGQSLTGGPSAVEQQHWRSCEEGRSDDALTEA